MFDLLAVLFAIMLLQVNLLLAAKLTRTWRQRRSDREVAAKLEAERLEAEAEELTQAIINGGYGR